jgi:WD40 repeat protein
MGIKTTSVIAFPEDFPPVTTGVLLLDKKLLITGHKNGFLVRWNLENGTYRVLFKSDSPVMTVSFSGEKTIAVGYHSGGLYVIELDDESKVQMLRSPQYSVNSRVWRTLWPDNKNLLLTSTYGELTPFRESNGKWKEEFLGLKGHSNSIFGIDCSEGKYIATGDYRGNIIIWKHEDGRYIALQKLPVIGNIQDICWTNERCFAVITDTGKTYLIERKSAEKENWETVLEIDIANYPGICTKMTDDGTTIFLGTIRELIQFDLESYQSETKALAKIRRIFASGKQIYILTENGLDVFEKGPVEIKRESISYKFVKISLLGHTGTGKTTFCNRLLSGKIDKIYSTFGKRIYNYILDKNGVEKRIIFHDHGGQETVLDTFIPFILDSDMILVFHKKTDKTTFNRSLEILKEIREKVSQNVPVYFIQTFVDHGLDDIPPGVLESLTGKGQIVDFVKMSPTDDIGFDEFKRQIIEKINWEKSRTMVQSPYIAGISKTLSKLRGGLFPVISFERFKEVYQQTIGESIATGHLRFLLEDFTNQGIIEFYPEISDLIILDDINFNKMRTDIPIYADHMEGIVDINELRDKFKNDTFLAIIDRMYLKSKIAIENGALRIFPHKLQEKQLKVEEEYIADLKNQKPSKVFVEYQEINIGRLIELLSELQLHCVGLTKKEGLFAWEKNAYIYYMIQEECRDMFKRYIRFNFVVGGEKEKIKEKLRREFINAVERLFGPLLEPLGNEDKKKVLRNYEFDVALSFAGEQRNYVDKVANILKSKGLGVFYDEFERSHMWGKNLIEYFQQVYYSKSKFCIMFISSDYLRKMWPIHEKRSATARDLEEFGEYILPVIFEDVDVPGLDKYRGYLDARKMKPEDIAKAFLEKLEHDEKEALNQSKTF